MLDSSPGVTQTLVTARGECRIRHPAHGILHTWVRGHMCAQLAQLIINSGNAVMDREGSMVAFHEWDQVETYDSEARKLLTDWGYHRRASVRKVHIVFRSRLVAMGVSVASVALGDMIQAHADSATFHAALRAAVSPPQAFPSAARAART